MPAHAISGIRGRLAMAADLIRAHALRDAEDIPVSMATGVAAIDEALPGGGLRPGVHEIAAPTGDQAGVGFAAVLAARRPGPVLWCRSRGTAVDTGDPYGIGLESCGLAVDRLILVDAPRPADLLWAMEEGARTRGLAAVVGEGAAPDLTASRRLQLAAESGKGWVLLLPPGRRADPGGALAPLAAATRWLVAAHPSLPEAGGPGRPCWRVELRRCRGGGRPQSWIVEWDDATFSLSVVSLVADRALAAAG